MTVDAGIIFAVLLAALVMFVWERWRYDIVALLALLIAVLAGAVPADQAFAGFGHPAVITVAAVLIVSQGLQNSGVVDLCASWTTRVGHAPAVQVAALTALVAALSAFINNVGALSLLLPVAMRMARKSGTPASLLLMPLAFGSLLGGMTTLIGTPPNIIIATFRANHSGEPFRMFDFAPVGVGVAVAGVLYLALLGWRLVPKRISQPSPEDLFHLPDYIAELSVPPESKIVDQSVMALEEITDSDIGVVGIVRGELKLPAPSPYETIRIGDTLIVQADSEGLKAVMDAAQLKLASDTKHGEEVLGVGDVTLAEAIVKPGSQLEGNTVWTLNLRWRYGINLLGVSRHGARLTERLKDLYFRAGDILLLQGTEAALQRALPALGCLPLADRGLRIGRPRRLLIACGIFAAAVTAVTVGTLNAPIAFVGAALLLILTGFISANDAYDAIDWPIIMLLGAMIPIAHALEASGGATLIAAHLFNLSRGLPPEAIVFSLLVATMFLSDLVNNAAAALLMAPIAIRLASQAEVSADPMLIAVAVGASCAFLTPIGHQSNALVMGPGGYRFSDYWRVGLLLEVIIAVVAMPLILWNWPLHR